jgi:RNA polymerase sigma-70 factor, ECF subfamily
MSQRVTELPVATIERLFREHHGRAVAVLVRRFGSIELAEESAQDAFAEAVERWPVSGLPESPVGWIITTARHRAIDRLRRESSREDRHTQAVLLQSDDAEIEAEDSMRDDQLKLIFTCCHPAIAINAQVALALKLIGGLTTTEIARAFVVPEATMAQRLVRAKGKIRDAAVPYCIPEESELPARVAAVLAVIYLIFNEGHTASTGERLVRENLCHEAIRLARVVAQLLPDEPEVRGLLALLLLIDSRRLARQTPDGALVVLSEQNRTLWDRAQIDEGQSLVRWCLQRNEPGPYQIEAAINAVHSDADSADAVDWRQILALYDQMLVVRATPIVTLNRLVALAEVEGPGVALPLVDELDLKEYYLFHSVRADLLRRLDRRIEAAQAYDAAIARTENIREREFLTRRRRSLELN